MRDLEDKFIKAAKDMKQQLVDWRHDFHMHPELSFKEFRTADIIEKEMENLGLLVKRGVGYETGLTADLIVNESYPMIAFRADIDALAVTEDPSGKETYASTIPGCFHGCGHDGHTASLMGAATLLTKYKDDLKVNVRFIFQPAEELPPGGAKGMVEAGCLDGVEAVYGGHFNSPLHIGQAKCVRGWSLSTISIFKVEIQGKGTHTGYPHQGIDTTMVAAHMAVNFQTIVSRMMDPTLPKNISVMQIHVGEQDVTTPDTGYISGSYCTMDFEQMVKLEKEMERTMKATCDMFGAKATIEFHRGYPSLINNIEHADLARKVIKDILGQEGLVEARGTLGSEDFSYYLEKKPGAFYFIGAMNPNKGIDWPHHHPKFDLDDDALVYMTQTHLLIALRYPPC